MKIAAEAVSEVLACVSIGIYATGTGADRCAEMQSQSVAQMQRRIMPSLSFRRASEARFLSVALQGTMWLL